MPTPSIDMSTVTSIVLDDKDVLSIKDSENNILWQKNATQYTVTLTTNNSPNDDTLGRVYGAGTYYAGNVDIEASPGEGAVFLCWSDKDSDSRREITVGSDITLEAYFSLREGDDYTAKVDLEEGSVYPESYKLRDKGYAVFNAVPYEGYKFLRWIDVDMERVYSYDQTIRVAANREGIRLLAEFERI